MSVPETSRLLVVGSELWWTRSIQSIFEPFSYQVFTASSSERAIQHLTVSRPDAVIVNARMEEIDGIELMKRLRAAGLGREHPMILISEEPLRREARLDAFRAGAWDCLNAPLNGEELLLKMESYVGATRVATHAREQLLVDEASGLYNAQGIMRWARELGHAARRYNRAFGCAVFAPAQDEVEHSADAPEPGEIAAWLIRQGRTSDIVGRLSRDRYVVLASDTGPEGILTMASRFVKAEKPVSPSDPESPPVALRAGCYAVADLGVQMVEPQELITRATIALGRASGRRDAPVAFYVN